MFEIMIDNKKFIIPVSYFEEFINLDNESFNKVMNSNSYHDIELPYFLYALSTYYKNESNYGNCYSVPAARR